jgi:predicted nucleotide-binding protein with TIR-like domain
VISSHLFLGQSLPMSLVAITRKLHELVAAGLRCENYGQYAGWSWRVSEFLGQTFAAESLRFTSMMGDKDDWWMARGRQVGMLEGMGAFRADGDELQTSVASSSPASLLVSRRVFVVHGHDHGAKEAVARYIERLGLEVIILHEKPNEGRTVIEKVEAFSDVGFAVVLLTPDDLGAAKADAAHLKPRQNVVLELGYFLGKLKRSRVCALYTPGVEIPSDYQGVLFIELDEKNSWRTSLAQELSNARLPIDVAGLLGS